MNEDVALLARFWSKAHWTPDGDCFEWQGYRSPKGYGGFWLGDNSHPAHRVAYQLAHGVEPGALHVLHKCDNPPCVNPHHLYLGTNADNMRDKVARGRTFSMPGELHPSARLTWTQVAEIRKLHSEGHKPSRLAKRFGVSRRHVAYIISNQSWRT